MLANGFDRRMIPVFWWLRIEPDPIWKPFPESLHPVEPAAQLLLPKAMNRPPGLEQLPRVHTGITHKDNAGLLGVVLEDVSGWDHRPA